MSAKWTSDEVPGQHVLSGQHRELIVAEPAPPGWALHHQG